LKPALQAHAKLPSWFVHVASAAQLWLFEVHSFMSVV